MADGTKIEWTDATWNPITGCSVVSPGCTNCYAMHLAGTRLKHHLSRADLTIDTKAGPVWNGALRFNEQWLDQPLLWKRPRRIFVCAHGDLFHENAPDAWIDRVFAVMAVAHWHTFQVLTKRPDRMREYLSKDPRARIIVQCWGVAGGPKNAMRAAFEKQGWAALGEAGEWPLPNIWLGVSSEDQARAEERIPHLLETPAAVRFVSFEPLLGSVNLNRLYSDAEMEGGGLEQHWDSCITGKRFSPWADGFIEGLPRLDWVIAGGESGPGARPMHPDWARGLRDQCAGAGVPFFFKQWGEWAPTSSVDVYCHGANKRDRQFPDSEGVSMLADGRICMRDFSVAEHRRRCESGTANSTRAIEVDQAALGAFAASVNDERRELDNPLGYQWLYRIGKKAAGALLDGREHHEFPA